MTGRLFK